jgi:hypothetical protein
MKKTSLILMVAILGCGFASATTYYVSSSTGNDSNNGTSGATAWQTIAHVNGQAFQPGDSILFKRGDVWNESLVPPSSGSSGTPIAFDAYGTGAAPNLTGYYAVPPTSWVLVTGNAWKAAVPSTYSAINFCLFGSVWGQKVAAVSSNLTAKGDFYLANGFVYVFASGNPATFYNEPIVPMALSNVPVININGPTWLTFQHFLVNWFDQYGVYVQGTSDHLVFANMEADSMIPQGTQPLGFYVNESAPGPGDIKIYNSEAHLNYDAFRFDGTATAITMINDKAYANRDGALVDNTSKVAYAYCHFYASSLAVAGSTDVEWTSGTGPIAGAGNIAADTAPAVQVYQRYPAEVTLTVDDAGMTAGADSYYSSTVLPIADAAGVPVGAAITVGYPLAQTLISEFQGWINAGRDVTAHSISHTYYTNTDALDIQYTGSGTAATLNINSNVFTITVTGASDSVSYNLAQGQPQGTMLALAQALAATGKYTYSFFTPCQGPYGTGCSAYTAQALLTQDLAEVSGQDVKSAVYHMQLDVTQLTTDEITLSRQWMTTNLTGLPATPVFVYPGGYETTAMQGITEGVPYSGARGALKEDLGVKDTYSDGFNVQNITSFGVNPSWMGVSGVTPAVLNQKIQALVWKESVWGVPWGIFWHLNELTNDDPVGGTEITNLIQDFKASGATIQTNTSLVNWLLSGTQETGADGNDYYAFPATSVFSSGGGLDFRPTKNSPVVDAGENLGAAYELDINGVNQSSYGSGWEIGAHVYEGYATYGGGVGSGSFTIGALSSQNPVGYQAYTGFATVQPPSTPNMGGLTKNGAIIQDTSFPSGTSSKVMRCTDSAISPTNSDFSFSAGLGGSGDASQLFNSNSTMLHFNNTGGAGFLTLFNPSTLVCGNPVVGADFGKAITADLNQTTPGSASTTFNFGGGTFDWNATSLWAGSCPAGTCSVWYSEGTGTQIIPYTISQTTGQFTVGSPIADFQYAIPLGSLVSAWQASHTYTLGQYVTYTLTSGQAPAWTANHSYSTLGTILQPATSPNNSLNCAFKLSTVGTSGSSEPTWSTSGACSLAQITDGTAKWRNLGGGATFTYQLTSCGSPCTSGSSTPAFVPVSTGQPDLMTTVTDGLNSLVWTNSGPEVTPTWESFGGVSNTSTRFCEALSSDTYGYAAQNYSYNGDQGTGIFASCYNTSTNTYILLNTATGWMSQTTCAGGAGYNCTGGTQSMTPLGVVTALSVGPCGTSIHNMKGSSTEDYPVVTPQALMPTSSGGCANSGISWAPFLAFNSTTSAQLYYGSFNHWAIGYSHLVNVGQNSNLFGYATGAYTEVYDSTNPGIAADVLISWQPGCATTWVPNDSLPPCEFADAYDSHLSFAHNPGNTDTAPICGSIYNYATLAMPPALAAWQGEEVCVPSSPAWANGSLPSAQNAPWRFTHAFNSGGSSDFDVQFAISQLSGDGKFIAWSSDWNCTLGTTAGTSGPLYCGSPWVAGTTYTAGQLINPFSATDGSGTNYGVYEITTGGTSSGTKPTWFVCGSGTAGNTVTDSNGVVYTCQGTGNGRGDVFIVQLHT